MKLLANHISIWGLVFLLGLMACKRDEIGPQEPSHRRIVTSEMDFENLIRVNGTISFGDVSPGVISRTWTFPENVVDILESDNDVTSSEATVKAMFLEAGEHEVRLQQVFENPAYVGESVSGTELDTMILITVLDSIEANTQAYYLNADGTLGEALIMEDNAENLVTAGSQIRFVQDVIGEPIFFRWSFEGAAPATIEDNRVEVDVKYSQLGNFGMNFIAWRDRPGGRDTITYENLIKVVPSTEPVTLDDVVSQGQDIALVFSREIEPSSVMAGDFRVSIESSAGPLSPAIGTASIDNSQGNIVLLSLSGETIYDDDVVKVSYTPGAIITTDGVNSDAFTDEVMRFETKPNLLVDTDYDYSFENTFAENWSYLGWGDPWDKFTVDVSGGQAQDGTKSLLVDMMPGGGMIFGHKDQAGEHITFPVDADKNYQIGVWVYVEAIGSTPPGDEQPNIRFYWNPDTDWTAGDNPNLGALPVGEWVFSSTFAKFATSGPTRFMIRGVNQSNPEACRIYMDNISLSEVNLRP